MEGLIEGRVIHVVLDASYGAHAGQHRGARISQVIDAEKGIICAHIDLLPGDIASAFFPTKDSGGREVFPSSSFMPNCSYSDNKEPGSWHWLEGSRPDREYHSHGFRGWIVKNGHGFADTDQGLIDSRLIAEDLSITDNTQARMIADDSDPASWPPKLRPVETPLRHLFPLPTPRNTEPEESDEEGTHDHV